MAGIFVYSERNNLAAELLAFAKSSGRPSYYLTFESSDAQILQDKGSDGVYLLQGDSEMPETYAQSLAGFLREEDADLLVVGATPRGRDLAAAIAGHLACPMMSDVSEASFINGVLQASRILYGGAVQQDRVLESLSVLTMGAGQNEPISGHAEITTKSIESDPRVHLVETTPLVKQGVDISVAERIVCVGLGLRKEEDMQLVRELANDLDAEIGCTRGITEERHWLPAEQYIGLSGAVVKPQLYISLGVSGQVQHVYGIREAKVVVAIDTDERAPIFRAADYGIVGDMYEIAPLLHTALSE